LPLRYRYLGWKRVFATYEDGTSLATFFKRLEPHQACLIVIEDTDGYVFGGFCSEQWSPQKGYFGTGQSFLFSMKPTANTYLWTRVNDYFMHATRKSIAMGGGYVC